MKKHLLKITFVGHVKVTFFCGFYVVHSVVSAFIFDSTKFTKFSQGRPFVPSPTAWDFANVGASFFGAKDFWLFALSFPAKVRLSHCERQRNPSGK